MYGNNLNNNSMPDKKEIGYSLIFLVLTIYLISNRLNIENVTTSDLILTFIAILGSFVFMVSSFGEIKSLKSSTLSRKVVLWLTLVLSSAFFITAVIFLVKYFLTRP